MCSRLSSTEIESEWECLDIVSEPDNKATTWFPRTKARAYPYKSGTSSSIYLKENLATTSEGLLFQNYCPFYEAFNEVIGRMLSSGLIRYWYENQYKKIDNFLVEIGPQILTLDHLGVGFIACLIPLMLSILVFFIEILSKHIKNLN